MGSSSSQPQQSKGSIDYVYHLNISQRLDHLMTGFIRLNFAKKNDKYLPAEISALCIKYCGITKNNDYHLIKSNTEIQIENSRVTLKVVIIGAGATGKTSLYHRFLYDEFSDDYYDPTIADGEMKLAEVDGKHYYFDILDTAGCQEYIFVEEYMRWFRESDYFIFVYDITKPITLDVAKKYIDQIARMKDDVPFYGVLAGNKCDLEWSNNRQVTQEQGQEIINSNSYDNLVWYETSAKYKINSMAIFYQCARWYNKQQYEKNSVQKPKSNNFGCFL